MERVFITGRGLITPLGNSLAANESALRSGASGVRREQSFADHGLECTVAGIPAEVPDLSMIDRKKLRICPPTSMTSIAAALQVFEEAGIPMEEVCNHRMALVGGVASSNAVEIFDLTTGFVNSGCRLRSVTPFAIPRIMPSCAISNLSLIFGIKGESYDVTAACATSSVSLMLAARLIRSGLYDMVLAGGAEPIDWTAAVGFSACRALSRKFDATPERASRPFDRERDGFVLAGGAAYVLLESERSVRARGVRPITELCGLACNSNATDMVAPDTESSVAVMREAIADAGLKPSQIGYVNTHGTGTPVGDPIEMAAIREVMGSRPAINSTKSQTGHMVGATGAAEVIFTSLMLEKNFISPSINLEDPEPEFSWADFVRECRTGTDVEYALSNSFAFGGTNVALVLRNCK